LIPPIPGFRAYYIDVTGIALFYVAVTMMDFCDTYPDPILNNTGRDMDLDHDRNIGAR
jgi:hypothetical protein